MAKSDPGTIWSGIKNPTKKFSSVYSSKIRLLENLIFALQNRIRTSGKRHARKNALLSTSYSISITFFLQTDTDGSKMLHTLLVKHYNDLLERQSSERGRARMKFHTSMLGTFFVYTLGLSRYADFQQKFFVEISGKKFKTLCIT